MKKALFVLASAAILAGCAGRGTIEGHIKFGDYGDGSATVYLTKEPVDSILHYLSLINGETVSDETMLREAGRLAVRNEINIRASRKTHKTEPASTGYYVLSLPEGNYNLVIQSKDYKRTNVVEASGAIHIMPVTIVSDERITVDHTWSDVIKPF